jgi:hypothetical protein
MHYMVAAKRYQHWSISSAQDRCLSTVSTVNEQFISSYLLIINDKAWS